MAKLNEIIDETDIVQTDTDYTPKVKIIRDQIKTMGNIAKLFIWLSFILIMIIAGIGLKDPELAWKMIELLWDKLAAVYLVIFGNMLGKS